MKKILILMLVLAMATPFMFSWHDLTNTAGMGNYSIDLKLHNPAQMNYQRLEMEVGLPIHEKFKMYFWIKDLGLQATFNTDAAYNNGTAVSSQEWTQIQGAIRMYMGFNLTDTFQMNILIGGGSDNIGMNPFWGGGSAGYYKIVNFTNGTVETKKGCGLLQLGVGLVLKSAMFGGVIDNLTIINIVELRMGYGTSYMPAMPLLTNYANNVTDTITSTNNIKSEAFSIGYDLEVGTGIPLQIGLPRFNIGLSLQQKIAYYTMTKLERTGATDFATNPAKFYSYTNFKVNFGINPTDNISTNTWIRPAVEISNSTWTPTGVVAQTLFQPAFEVRVGQNIQITFAKICWVKFENEFNWKTQMNNATVNAAGQVVSVSGSMSDHTKTNALMPNQWSNSVLDNPMMAIGFKFTGWGLSASWCPRVTVYNSGTGNAGTPTTIPDGGQGDKGNTFNVNSGADTNLLNLSNWEIMMNVSFPPPKK